MASRVDAVPAARTQLRAHAAVHSARRTIGSLLVATTVLVMYGIAWDSTWHGSVGRDKGFLSPPHALMYASAAVAGLLCITNVLMETARYHLRNGVDDDNSVRIFRLFHAPIGPVVGGFGILAMVMAGPLDNYWHSLYGIFVNAWQPFHMMGLLGGAIWGVGNLYLWAALLLRALRETGRNTVEWWGFLATATVMMRLMMTISYPALHVFQTTSIGPVRFMTYPVVLVFTTVWLLTVVQAVLRRRWAAPALVVLLLGFHLVIQLTVPGVVRMQAAAEGRTFFNPTLMPTFELDRLAPDLGLLVGALMLAVLGIHSGGAERSRTGVVGTAMTAAPVFWVVGAVTTLIAQQHLARLALPPALHMRPLAIWQDALIALPLTIGAAALSALLGRGLGEVLRRNPR